MLKFLLFCHLESCDILSGKGYTSLTKKFQEILSLQ